MKTVKRVFASLVFASAFCASSTTLAVPIVDVVDPNPNVAIDYLGAYTFTHNLTDDGFVVGLDTLDSALLSILLRDRAGNEIFKFEIGIAQNEQYQNVNNGSQGATYDITLSDTSLTDLGSDGLINVTIKSLQSNNEQFQTGFVFDKSTLSAEVIKGRAVIAPQASAVPEPATVALLGLGLVGIAVTRRRT